MVVPKSSRAYEYGLLLLLLRYILPTYYHRQSII